MSVEIIYRVGLKDGRKVIGFAYPPLADRPRRAKADEVRIASHCFAIVGTSKPHEWANRDAASFVAEKIKGADVEIITR
jgi:hypothetical protein